MLEKCKLTTNLYSTCTDVLHKLGQKLSIRTLAKVVIRSKGIKIKKSQNFSIT